MEKVRIFYGLAGESQGIPAQLPLQRKAGLYYNKKPDLETKTGWDLGTPGSGGGAFCHVEKTQSGGPFCLFLAACLYIAWKVPTPDDWDWGPGVGSRYLVMRFLAARLTTGEQLSRQRPGAALFSMPMVSWQQTFGWCPPLPTLWRVRR